jgi:hypothetical protein
MAKRQRRIAEVVSATEATPIQDNLTNGKVAEVVSKTSEVTTPITEEEEPLLGGNSVTIDSGSGKVTTTGAGQYVAPGTALNNAIQSNTAAQTTENAVLKAGIDNAETAGQVFEAPKVAEEAKKEAEKMQTQLDVNAVNTVNALKEPVPIAPVTAAVMGNINANQTRPPYSSIATKNQVEKDITDQYRNLDSSIPQAVVEKLGVQDYYPEIGRDIAVGTFTGSRIGSQTVYSGAGGLLPQGLYDARKRALNESAKAKQTALDKYYSGIDIAAQFKPKFNETVNDAMDNLLYKKHGGNVNAFLADPESRREFSRLEAVAKNVNHYDAYATSILKDAADDTKFIDPEQVKNAQDIKRALVEDVDGVLNGKKDLSELFAKAQVYQNIIPQMDDVIKEALSESRLGKLPINMRTGGVYEEPKFVEERNQYIQKLNDGTLENADYLSGFKKFFTGDYERIIDGLVQSGKYSDLQKDAAMNYFAGQMQQQVELKNQFVATGALGAMRLAEDKRQFNAEYARKVEQGETPWDIRNDMMSSKNPNTGKTIQQEFMDMKKQGLTGNALKNKMLQTARNYGFSGASWDPHTKSVILKENATTYESGNVFAVNPYNTKSPAMVKVYTKVTKGGKSTWVPTTVTVNELANSKWGKYNFKDGKDIKPFTKEDISNYSQAIKENALAIQPLTYESTWGSVGSKTGNYNPFGTETISDYSIDRAVNLKHTTGKGFITIPMKDADGKPVIGADGKPMLKKTALNGELFVQSNISDPFGRTAENAKFGDNKKSFEWVSGEGGGSQSSGSVSSSNQ